MMSQPNPENGVQQRMCGISALPLRMADVKACMRHAYRASPLCLLTGVASSSSSLLLSESKSIDTDIKEAT